MNVTHLRSDPSYRCITCGGILQFTFHSIDNALLLPAWCPDCNPEKLDNLKLAYDEHESRTGRFAYLSKYSDQESIERAYRDSIGLMSLHLRSLTDCKAKALLDKHPELIRRLSMSSDELRKVYSQ